MTTSERYNFGNFNRPNIRHEEEAKSEESGSPEKLFFYLDQKGNLTDKENIEDVQKEGLSLSDEKAAAAFKAGQMIDIPIRSSGAKKPLGELNNLQLSHSASMGASQNSAQTPKTMASVLGLKRSATSKGSENFQLNRNEIKICVTNPLRKGDVFKKHTFFCIEGHDGEGAFKVTRSHEDFIKIRNVLVKRWPGCYVPSVPPIRVMTKVDLEFLEGRRREFEMFVQKITELPHLQNSREYQLFIRSASTDFDADLAPFQNVTHEDILMRYKATFRHALQLRVTPEAEKKIQNFRVFLQTVRENFMRFKKVLKATVAARRTYYQQLLLFHEVMGTGYEKDVLAKLEDTSNPKHVFQHQETSEIGNRFEGVKEASQHASIEYLHSWVKAEAREIGAFLQAIEQKDNYDSRRKKAADRLTSTTKQLDQTVSGKTGIMGMFSLKSRDDQIVQLEGRAVGQDKESKQLQAVYEAIVLVLAHNEIEKFKERKSEQYHHVVNLAAQYELNNIQSLIEYWDTVLSIDTARKASSIQSVEN